MHVSSLSAILLLAVPGALTAPAATGGDALIREFCQCEDGSGGVGYKRIISYINGRTGETSNSNEECVGVVANPPQCNTDTFYLPGVRSCSADKRFCYDAEITSKDKYSWDGKTASLKDAGEPSKSGLFGCDTLCNTLKEGFKPGPLGNTNEAYYSIQPGL